MRVHGVCFVVLAACGALRENPLDFTGDDDPDLPGLDASTADSSGEQRDAGSVDAAPDARPPPIRDDVACAGPNAWHEADRIAECEARKIRVVQATPSNDAFAHGNLDIAWSLSARVGVVLAWESGLESGYLQALTFDTALETFTVRPDLVMPPEMYQIEGAGARIAARADGSFDVLSMRDESRNGGDVLLRRLPVNQPFLEPDVVFSSAYRSAQLGLLVHPNGVVTATAATLNGSGLTIATKQRQVEATAFDDIQSGGNLGYDLRGTTTNGNHRMTLDSVGASHIAYERGRDETSSQPRYARSSGRSWDFTRTVDNPTNEGASGAEISIAVFGAEKNVVYVQQARDVNDEALPYVQIVRARWRGATEAIVRSVLVDHLPVYSGMIGSALLGVTAAAAMDASGALHLVYAVRVDADADAARCQVRYLHEAARAGAIQLLDDEVSPLLSCPASTPPVALAVEPGGRPHIAYISVDQGVVYATRYDR